MNFWTELRVINKYTGGGIWAGLSVWLVTMVMWGFCLLAVPYKVLGRWRRNRHSVLQGMEVDIRPQLIFARDAVGGSLTLAVTNRSRIAVWAEEAKLVLSDLEAELQTSTATGQAILKIREFVAPKETLYISFVEALYDAAGRPQGEYSFVASTVLQCRADENDEEKFETSLPSYRARMVALGPIGLRRMRWFDKPAGRRGPDDTPALQRKDTSNRERRSQRVLAQSPVAVQVKSTDGSPFVDFTRALVLSANGCLVTLSASVKLGEKLILQNVASRQELNCRVVYLGERHGGGTKVGLGFTTAAPHFWGLKHPPSNWASVLN